MNPKIKNFLTIGIVGLLSFSIMAKSFAGIQPLDTEAPLQQQQIVQMYKESLTPAQIKHIETNGLKGNQPETLEIKETIAKKTFEYGLQSHLDKLKIELGNSIPEHLKDIHISYSLSVPNDILDSNVRHTDTSIAWNSFTKDTCNIEMRLGVDSKGRLFESSELSHTNLLEISKQSNEQIFSVLKETLLHEISHCSLQKDLIGIPLNGFKLTFSEEYINSQNPINLSLLNQLSYKLGNLVDTFNKTGNFSKFDSLEFLVFVNFHENFSDVNSALLRLGDGSPEKIQEVKEQLTDIYKMRSNAKSQLHQTQNSILETILSLDKAAPMNAEQRTQLALQIVSDNLMTSIRDSFSLFNKNNINLYNHNTDSMIVGFLNSSFSVNFDNITKKQIPTISDDDLDTQYEHFSDYLYSQFRASYDGDSLFSKKDNNHYTADYVVKKGNAHTFTATSIMQKILDIRIKDSNQNSNLPKI